NQIKEKLGLHFTLVVEKKSHAPLLEETSFQTCDKEKEIPFVVSFQRQLLPISTPSLPRSITKLLASTLEALLHLMPERKPTYKFSYHTKRNFS
ncbi:MAG: hypothetical protein AAF599_13175, partial [Bacteroidota bacterium]